ncbi:MAG: hypothetical protein ACKVTZ_22575 [Bacteroidia bacterium]
MKTYCFTLFFCLTYFGIYAQISSLKQISLDTFSCVIWAEYVQASPTPLPFGYVFFCKDVWFVLDKSLNTKILDTLAYYYFDTDALKRKQPKDAKVLNQAKRMMDKNRLKETIIYLTEMRNLDEDNAINSPNGYRLNMYSYHQDSFSKINRYVNAFNVEVIGLTVKNWEDDSNHSGAIYGGHKVDSCCWKQPFYSGQKNRFQPLYCKKITPLTEQQIQAFYLTSLKVRHIKVRTH